MPHEIVPVVVFAYARPQFLARTLDALEREAVPLVYVFCDGPKNERERALTDDVRTIAAKPTSHERIVTTREANWGLGQSILAGVTEVLRQHPWAVVLEDDLQFVPGTYRYFCEALTRYRHEPRAMSITAWTHPSVTPTDISSDVYFDGRAESWSFATWSRAWKGMEHSALIQYARCRRSHVDTYRYGRDLVAMVRNETRRNLWAARFVYHHMLNDGLCLRPRQSLVNVGFDTYATNAPNTQRWLNAKLPASAPSIESWPDVVEAYDCSRLWQQACGERPPLAERLRDDVYTALSRNRLFMRAHMAVRHVQAR
jgi:hypothetical protein